MDPNEILITKSVKKSFDGVTAVDGCSFQVEKGSITSLIGPNGAGKTTLFNILSGFYEADQGEIIFDGKNIEDLKSHEISRLGLVRTFQITRALSRMKVIENLMLSAQQQQGENIWNIFIKPKDVKKQEEEIKERAFELLEFLDLTHLKDEYAGTLSGGQKKLLELGRALMTKPKMILLDEPFAGVNPTLSKKIINYIEQLRDEGETFLLVEHDMPLVMDISKKILVMAEGKIIAEGKPGEIKQNEKVIDAYLGAVHD